MTVMVVVTQTDFEMKSFILLSRSWIVNSWYHRTATYWVGTQDRASGDAGRSSVRVVTSSVSTSVVWGTSSQRIGVASIVAASWVLPRLWIELHQHVRQSLLAEFIQGSV